MGNTGIAYGRVKKENELLKQQIITLENEIHDLRKLITLYHQIRREAKETNKDKEPVKKHCYCEKQIVWFFEKPTVIVCEECEITLHHTAKTCPRCGGKVSYFVKEIEE